MARISIAVWLLLFSGFAGAQGAAPGQYNWEEFGKRIKASQTVNPLGSNLYGDGVSLSNGALSFSATDVSLPGNNSLPVAFSRSYSVFNRKDYLSDGMLADWQLEAPSINGIFAPEGWVVYTSESGISESRCSIAGPPPSPVVNFPTGLSLSDFWQGINIDIPGHSSSELLKTMAATTQPGDGLVYRHVTSDQTHVSCLPSIKNGTGEGYLAVTADGTRYWFDWMAQNAEPPLKWTHPVAGGGAGSNNVVSNFARRKHLLYATRVEDRFGNRVEYVYTNAWNQPGKLTKISGFEKNEVTASRTITVSYSGNYISSVSDGTHSWAYAYGDTTSGRKTLTSVTQPDGSAWAIDFAGFTNAEIKYNEVPMGEILRTCTMNEVPLNVEVEPVGSITHPSGATGTFTVNIQEHGRSNVPVNCGHVEGTAPGNAIGNDPNNDVNLYATSSNSFTLKQKRVSGPGIVTADWNYIYAPGNSVYFNTAMGVTHVFPVCTPYGAPACSAPVCTSPNCGDLNRPTVSSTTILGPGGEWERHTHGNSYRYNEGKLLKIERGNNAQQILETVTSSYDFSQLDQAYPARYGVSQRFNGDGFASEYHRPLTSRVTNQQGASFVWLSTSFNYFAQPLTIAKWSELVTPGTVSYGKTDAIEYENNLDKWVIGQVKKVIEDGTNVVEVGYDPITASQLTYKSYGTLMQTLAYNADGTVATVKDGNDNITTLASWKAGIPRLITFPATSESPAGAIQSAVINNFGWIESVTNELGALTSYGYDSMGRLTQIVFPTDDSTTWNGT